MRACKTKYSSRPTRWAPIARLLRLTLRPIILSVQIEAVSRGFKQMFLPQFGRLFRALDRVGDPERFMASTEDGQPLQ